jgi:hypothetical protein
MLPEREKQSTCNKSNNYEVFLNNWHRQSRCFKFVHVVLKPKHLSASLPQACMNSWCMLGIGARPNHFGSRLQTLISVWRWFQTDVMSHLWNTGSAPEISSSTIQTPLSFFMSCDIYWESGARSTGRDTDLHGTSEVAAGRDSHMVVAIALSFRWGGGGGSNSCSFCHSNYDFSLFRTGCLQKYGVDPFPASLTISSNSKSMLDFPAAKFANSRCSLPPYKLSPHKGKILLNDILSWRKPEDFVRNSYPIGGEPCKWHVSSATDPHHL